MEGSELIQMFERELRQNSEQMQSILLDLERKQNFSESLPLMQEAYRLAHTLKGASRVVGLLPIEEMAHAMEDQIQRLLREESVPNHREISTFLRVDDAFVAAFEAFIKGEIFESAPIATELRALSSSRQSELAMIASAVREQIFAPTETPVETAPSFHREEHVMVRSRQIDDLFRRMEEAFLIESRITALLSATDTLFQEATNREASDVWHKQYANLKNEAARLHFVLMHFHDIVRTFRMVPIKRLKIAALKSMRDLSLTFNKPVNLDFHGEHQMLDATVLEALQEPVLHMIRNALDHGIETQEERLAKGKPLEGQIAIKAVVTGGFLHLSLSDDGRGIKTETIRRKAIDLKIVAEHDAHQLSSAECLELLFRPGFSTAESVSAISGRGLGMDIVRRRVRDAGGNLEILTEPEVGTTFLLRVPIGLLTPRVLLVQCANRQAALHISDIERVFAYDPQIARQINGTTMVEWNGKHFHLESLAAHLGWNSTTASPPGHVVLINRQGQRKGLLVDQIIAEIEQVAFPPPWNLRGLPYLSGVIIMGDGSVVPVVETQTLLQKLEQAKVGLATEVPASALRVRTVLLVDDSPTIVALHRSILKNAGYRILTAENGVQAWQAMQSHPVDLLLTDIEMPQMNGIELIQKVRSDASHKNLPIIVISQHGSREDLQKAANAGADRYIVKSSFQPEKLLESIQDLLTE